MFGKAGMYAIYLLIGFGFGYVLEAAGFANSPRLAAQFYFKDQTVLKVMFTAIVTAMVLIYASSGMDILDDSRIWINPTYLLPGIVGGLIMGAGFIIGGFCPGTSLVAVATLKVDGIFFFLGVSVGVLIFGETVSGISSFWNSTYMGRLTIHDWLGLDAGVVVLAVVTMALGMFAGAERLERIFGERAHPIGLERNFRRLASTTLVAVALFVALVGQPDASERWMRVQADSQPMLDDREVQIHPDELNALMNNDGIRLVMLDVRNEAEYNLFHIRDAFRIDPEASPDHLVGDLPNLTDNTVIVVMSNAEQRSAEAWKVLIGHSLLNVYLLDGGINHWLEVFGHDEHARCSLEAPPTGLRHVFDAALGSRTSASDPKPRAVEFEAKVKVERRTTLGGGCG
jgi:rhodanese-related sulfurtransferase